MVCQKLFFKMRSNLAFYLGKLNNYYVVTFI